MGKGMKLLTFCVLLLSASLCTNSQSIQPENGVVPPTDVHPAVEGGSGLATIVSNTETLSNEGHNAIIVPNPLLHQIKPVVVKSLSSDKPSATTSPSLLSLSEAHAMGDPFCDRSTPKCCEGLKCPYVDGVCCTGAQFCCPSGSLCLAGETTKCVVGLAPTSPGSPWAQVPRPPTTTVNNNNYNTGCPCAQASPCAGSVCPAVTDCACAAPKQLVEAEVDKCGQSGCQAAQDLVNPQIVEADAVESDGMLRVSVLGHEQQQSKPAANETSTTVSTIAPPVTQQQQVAPTPAVTKTPRTPEEVELEKVQYNKQRAEEVAEKLAKQIEDVRAVRDTLNGVKIDTVRRSIRGLETTVVVLGNETVVKEKADEQRQKKLEVEEARVKKDENTKEQAEKKQSTTQNESQFKSSMTKMQEEQKKALDEEASKKKAYFDYLATRQQQQLKSAQDAVKQTAAETNEVVATAATAATQSVSSEQKVKNAITNMKAMAAAEKAKLDQEVQLFERNAMEAAKQKVEATNKIDAEQTQKSQDRVVDTEVRRLQTAKF